MNRLWSIVFAMVPLLAIGTYAWSVADGWPLRGAWLPECLSYQGQTIDSLFRQIHWLAAAILAITGSLLAWILWRYADREGRRAHYVHSHRWLEVAWTIVPAVILVWLSLHQMNAWAENRIRRPEEVVDGRLRERTALARVVAKQFGWEVYYPGPDGLWDTIDDLYVENELIVPVETDVVLELRSRDVIHDFFVPKLRLKQDIVPGMPQHLWFRAIPAAAGRRFDIVCAELCGWGHYKMNGWLVVVTPEVFAERMRELAERRFGTDSPHAD